MQRLRDAQTAFVRGTATAEQLHLLEQERAGEELSSMAAETKRRKKEAGVWTRVKALVGSSAGSLGREGGRSGGGLDGEGERLLVVEEGWVPGEVAVRQSMTMDPASSSDEVVVPRRAIAGGPLDVYAGNIAGALSSSSSKRDSSWMSWMRGERPKS